MTVQNEFRKVVKLVTLARLHNKRSMPSQEVQEVDILPLTVTDHTALARGPTLRLRHRECAQLAVLHTRAVCDQTGSFSEAIMIAFFYSTLANQFEKAPHSGSTCQVCT